MANQNAIFGPITDISREAITLAGALSSGAILDRHTDYSHSGACLPESLSSNRGQPA
jgi:hypothetical protein